MLAIGPSTRFARRGIFEVDEMIVRTRVPDPRGRSAFGVVLFFVLVLVPVFWQSRVQAGDFATHVYNAWLASLIAQGKVHGLSLAGQPYNILFDRVLQWLLLHTSVGRAQRIALSGTVLIFAGGMILFIKARAKANWYFLAPCVAMVTYGFIYHMGFFNFYLALGLCLWYLGIFYRVGWLWRVLALPLLALAWLAHPLPVVWALAIGIYVLIAGNVSARRRLLLLVLALLSIVFLHVLLKHLYACEWQLKQIFSATGADQLLAFGLPRHLTLVGEGKYVPLSLALLAVWLSVFVHLVKAQGFERVFSSIPFQLWLICAAGAFLIPDAIAFSQYASPLSYIKYRLSLTAAVMACALLSAQPLKTIQKTALALVALLFFGFVYTDTRALNQGEDNVEAAVKQLPPGQRVVGFFPPKAAPRMNPLQHALDRSCIGRCFSYADYEPATLQFQVRARPDNGVVLSEVSDVRAVWDGSYMVQRRDLPLYELYVCGSPPRSICSSSLREGDEVAELSTGKSMKSSRGKVSWQGTASAGDAQAGRRNKKSRDPPAAAAH
jgi:hypothetical protein